MSTKEVPSGGHEARVCGAGAPMRLKKKGKESPEGEGQIAS